MPKVRRPIRTMTSLSSRTEISLLAFDATVSFLLWRFAGVPWWGALILFLQLRIVVAISRLWTLTSGAYAAVTLLFQQLEDGEAMLEGLEQPVRIVNHFPVI